MWGVILIMVHLISELFHYVILKREYPFIREKVRRYLVIIEILKTLNKQLVRKKGVEKILFEGEKIGLYMFLIYKPPSFLIRGGK